MVISTFTCLIAAEMMGLKMKNELENCTVLRELVRYSAAVSFGDMPCQLHGPFWSK